MSEYIVCVDDLEESYYRYTDIKPETVFGHRLREEIVRYRDCRYLDEIKVSYSVEPYFQCMADWCQGLEGDSPFVEPDGFCAWGERRA